MTFSYNPENIKSQYGRSENVATKEQLDAATGFLVVDALNPPGVVTLTVDQLEPVIFTDSNLALPTVPIGMKITVITSGSGSYTVTTDGNQDFLYDAADVRTVTLGGSYEYMTFVCVESNTLAVINKGPNYVHGTP